MSTDGAPMPALHHEPATSRREWLARSGAGFGSVAFAALLDRAARGEPRPPHHPPRARSVIFLFMEGGPSHIDLFDPKPALKRLEGKPLPESFGSVITAMGESRSPILADRRTWKRHGASGIWVSDWLPHTAEIVDDIAVIRSCVSDGINHSGGVCQMNTGSVLGGRPSLGAWVTYGLGCETDDLPAFVVMQDRTGPIVNGPRNWGAGFMPAVHQATRLAPGEQPIANLRPPMGVSSDRQRAKLDLLDRWNRQAAAAAPEQSELEARIRGYELAFRMQAAAPEAVDLAGETEETRRLYGIDGKETASFGRTCLMARRLVERGVRFVQLYHGAGSKWDAHTGIEKNHAELCGQIDRPVAGLLTDLRRRGLLDSTLVIWGGEFGRTPMSEKGNGRDHNPTGFTMWMAGAGVPGGTVIGATDEAGLRAVEEPMHVHDLHATILAILGLDHLELVYAHQGRPERPTLNEGVPHRRLVGS
ncbi:MAG: DUF1501 domain-containing protein [Planctomycetaceae bacterium]